MATVIGKKRKNLYIKDLSYVLEVLRKHGYSGTNYYELGLYFGLSVATLKTIEANHKGDVNRCLLECLSAWLCRVDGVDSKGGPTWLTLRDALKKLNENAVADGIEDIFPQMPFVLFDLKLNEIQTYTLPKELQCQKQIDNANWKLFRKYSSTLSIPDVDKLITSAHSKYLISLAVKKHIKRLTDDDIKRKAIMISIGEMIQNSKYHKRMLERAVGILRELDVELPKELSKKVQHEKKINKMEHKKTKVPQGYIEYTDHLRHIYSHLQPHTNFISPSMTEVNTGNDFSINDILSLQYSSRVFIEGPSGIGKTCLANEICRQWVAKKNTCKQYPLFLLFELNDRDNHKYMYEEDNSKAALFLWRCHLTEQSWKAETLQTIINTEGRGVFILLEGYNELPKKLQYDSFNLNLIKGELLPCATVLVTSQPCYALEDCKTQHIIRVVHIEGFNKDGENNSSFKKFPLQIQACLHIPIINQFVSTIASESIPESITELYQQMVDHNTGDDPSSLKAFGQLAWDGIRNNKFVFNHVPPKLLGLMEIHNIKQNKYKFIHQTVQEYLAAYFISQHASDEEIKQIFQKCKDNPQFSGTLRFLAGLLKNSLPVTITPNDKPIIGFNIFHQLHESGSSIDHSPTDEITVSQTWPPPFPHDMYVLGSCISKSKAKWRLGFTLRNLTAEHIKALANGIGPDPTCKIITFSFSLNNLGNKGVETLLQLTSDVTELINIRGNGLRNGFKLPPLPKNVKIFLNNDNEFSPGEQIQLIKAVCNHPSIKQVSFSNLSPNEVEQLITGSSSIEIIKLYQLSSKTISTVMSSLAVSRIHTLHIERSKIELSHIEQLSLHHNTSLTTLELVNCGITSETFKHLGEAIQKSKVQNLNLNDNLIDKKDIIRLENLYTLQLEGNTIHERKIVIFLIIIVIITFILVFGELYRVLS